MAQSQASQKTFVFVGNRLEVLNAMLESCAQVFILLEQDSFAAKTMHKQQKPYFTFDSKAKLLQILESLDFDVLVSNGCPYILPVSSIKKPHQIFINCHPSLLPNLKGKHPINGAILYHQPSGATCHIMNDAIDSGAIISQVPVYNDSTTPLSLLYQMCFLAEKEAFLQALARDFKPQTQAISKAEVPYFTYKEKDLELDFANDSTQKIINTIRAFARPNRMAGIRLNNQWLRFSNVQMIQNTFLDTTFKDNAYNDVVLRYDEYLLCKRKEGFLQLTIGGGAMKESAMCVPKNLATSKTKPESTALHIPHCVFMSPPYAASMAHKERVFCFEFKQDSKLFSNTAIIEQIPETSHYDMSSPYGYGGYFTNTNDLSFLAKALQAQKEKAKTQGVIAEFVRFHPLFEHTKIFAKLLDFFHLERYVIEVSTDSLLRWQTYSSRLRGKLRKSLQTLTIRQTNDIKSFIELYTQTMLRNKAEMFYYFPLSYFEALLALPQTIMLEARFEGALCAMGIFLFDELCGYYHLGANAPLTLANNLNAMGALFEEFFKIAHTKGVQSCILGGGRSGDNQDSLFMFKKQFATSLKPFYIGGLIVDRVAYEELCAKAPESSRFFLAYRAQKEQYENFVGGGAKYTLKILLAESLNSCNYTIVLYTQRFPHATLQSSRAQKVRFLSCSHSQTSIKQPKVQLKRIRYVSDFFRLIQKAQTANKRHTQHHPKNHTRIYYA